MEENNENMEMESMIPQIDTEAAVNMMLGLDEE